MDAPPLPGDVHLSEQQLNIKRKVLEGESVCITGPAGSGKTVLLLSIIHAFKERYGKEFRQKLAVTASTGVAGQ